TFKVVVGQEPEQQTFLVHEEILCNCSEFFRRAMNGDWAESSDRVVKLPEDEADTFELYLNLVYTGNIPIKKDTPTPRDNDASDDEDGFDPLHILVRIYILAEKLQDVLAKNQLVRSLLALLVETDRNGYYYRFVAYTIFIIYDETPKNSGLRRIAIHSYTDPMWEGFLEYHKNKWPREFLFDLALAFMNNRDGP
ncbi:hypothetical protein DM02DRAFT_484747, partial [Periconia macrospinosa]